MSDPIILRDAPTPSTLMIIRLGVQTLSDERLVHAAQRCYGRWGIWGFSVLEVPDGNDYHSSLDCVPS